MRLPKGALARPELRVLLGCVAVGAFAWPLVALDRPLDVLTATFGAWLVTVIVLFLLSRCDDGDDPEAGGDDV